MKHNLPDPAFIDYPHQFCPPPTAPNSPFYEEEVAVLRRRCYPIRFEPPAPETVPGYLEPYGLKAKDAASWVNQRSGATAGSRTVGGITVDLDVSGHIEEDGHTWYVIDCRIKDSLKIHEKALKSKEGYDWLEKRAIPRRPMEDPGGRAKWRSCRRLSQLRVDLHDRLKDMLGHDLYGELFAGAPFAHRGGRSGTTLRLKRWCARLADCVNSGSLPPSAVALMLHFLDDDLFGKI